jgi:tryptophan 2,3-dioxygenase
MLYKRLFLTPFVVSLFRGLRIAVTRQPVSEKEIFFAFSQLQRSLLPKKTFRKYPVCCTLSTTVQQAAVQRQIQKTYPVLETLSKACKYTMRSYFVSSLSFFSNQTRGGEGEAQQQTSQQPHNEWLQILV